MAKPIREILDLIERGERLTASLAKDLLNIDVDQEKESFETVVHFSRTLKSNLFKGAIYPIVPVYVSSICQEYCTYCNYRVLNKGAEIHRLRLTDEQLEREIQFLVAKGHRAVELVYATDQLISVQDVARHIELTKRILRGVAGITVGLNARPMSIQQYEVLKCAGLDFAVLWQETYDRDLYHSYHPNGTEKSDYGFRFEAHERMLSAGLRNIGLGVLSGLTSWREDWFRLFYRISDLNEKFGGGLDNIVLGIPRLRPAAGALFKETAHVPTDRQHLLAICVFNLLYPESLPFVNTRESWENCIRIAEGGGVLFTFDCSTIPGGYSLGARGYQFPTGNYSLGDYSLQLPKSFSVFRNWGFRGKTIPLPSGSESIDPIS